MATKKTWKRPKLIILLRGKPEENVLAGCKMMGSKQKNNNQKAGCTKVGKCNRPCAAVSTS